LARIVYGVAGQGSGHSSRAREMATHLLNAGHQVRLVSYDRGYRNLKDDFDVFETEGLCIASADNRVSVVRTFTENLKRLPSGHKRLQQLRKQLFKQFQPDCVITDFEPMTAYLASHYDVPLISLDNQHRMRYMRYDYPRDMKVDRRVTKSIIQAMVPRPDVSLVITFYFGEVKNERTFLFPPILRREVLEAEATQGEHVLVYLTDGYESLLEILAEFRRERFLVYGYDRDETEGALTFKPFSREGFLNDLASSKAVMATAGFTLISEALHLHKPYLAMPMDGQFEQQLNAFQLEGLGYGVNVRKPTRKIVGDFLYRVPDFVAALDAYPARDNSEITAKLDELTADDAALAREYHRRRQ
jgi:uncharacterized protein (TIGR00661 family)